MSSHLLRDIHMYLHQHDTTIPTYNRGTKRIDYILGTTTILPYVTKGGLLPFHYLKNTDHRTLYVELELQRILRNQESTIGTTTNRALTSTRPRGVIKYCQQLNNTSIESELATVHQKEKTPILENDKQLIIQLDQQFQDARLQAERGLHKYGRHPWSPKLRQAQLQVYCWKLWVSQYKTHHNHQDQRDKLQLPQQPIPHTEIQA